MSDKKIFIFHPFLFAVFPILFLFAHNVDEAMFVVTELGVTNVLLPLLYVLTATTIFFFGLRWPMRNSHRAGLLVSLLLFICFSYGHFAKFVSEKALWFPRDYLLLCFLLLCAGGCYYLCKTRRNFVHLSRVLNAVSLFLVVVSLGNITFYGLERLSEQQRQKTQIAAKVSTDEQLPDIYYFILDRYADADTLRERFGFDNSEFLDFLRSKGFYLAKSSANYPITKLSLASSLNMRYLDDFQQQLGDSGNSAALYEIVTNHEVGRFLKSQGYTYIHAGSWWGPTAVSKQADININLDMNYREFSDLLLQTTIFTEFFWHEPFRKAQYHRALYKFQKLAEVPKMPGPKFVFAHMLLPHEPYVFDKDGKLVGVLEVKKRGYKKNFTEQLQFTNNKIRQLVEQLLENSQKPPIIILQADEGLYPPAYEKNIMDFDWRKASPKEIQEKMRILNAYYTPGLPEGILYKEISPVNTFRLIFKYYLAADFELLPDKHYCHTSKRHLYQFFDVSEQLKNIDK